MSQSIRRYGRGMLFGAALALGTFALAYSPAPAAATEVDNAEVTCWAESCEGNVCVRVKIKCPNVIEPVT